MRKKITLFFLIITFGLLVFIEFISPKEPNWTVTLLRNDKNPFGTYILFDLLNDVFKNKEIIVNRTNFYQNNNLKKDANLVILDMDFAIDSLQLNDLLQFVSRGNSAFIAASSFSNNFMDTLNFNTTINWKATFKEDSSILNLANPVLKNDTGYIYNRAIYHIYFSRVDSANTLLLGAEKDTLYNFICVPYGNGRFFLSTQPIAFTNYNLLNRNNYEYIFKSLSYLTEKTIIWDEYFKPVRAESNPEHPMRFILSSQSLKVAYYLIIIGLIIFAFFESKRKQRPIPVIKPYPNTSLEFIETIGRLYLHRGVHIDLAKKRYMFLLDFLRTKYYINIRNFKDLDVSQISQKTGASQETIQKLFLKAQAIYSYVSLTEDELFDFNKLIETFYKECK